MFNQLEKTMTANTVFSPSQSSWWRLGRYATGFAFAAMLAACGGGADSTTDTGGGGGTPTTCTTNFTDSFGNQVTCATMKTLAGAEFVGGDSGSGDAGADGTGADGAAIANATIRITDANGKVVTTTTDATGYFRVNIGGLKQPLVAAVQRSNNAWRSAMVEVIQPGRSQFYTLNLTGLTDLVLTELASASGVSGGSNAVTPAVLTANSSRLPTAVQTVNQRVAAQLQAAGLSTSTFNPLTSAFRADSTGYDQVLDSVTITKSSDGTTTLDPTGGSTLTGQWNGTTVVEGQTISLGTVDGSAVPASLPNVSLTSDAAYQQIISSYAGSSYTITTNGNVVTITGPGTNLTVTINSFSAGNYAGCGSCGVGSTVSYSISYSFTYNGTDAGETFNNLVLSGSITLSYQRIS